METTTATNRQPIQYITTTGDSYDRDLDITDIAKLIRKDITAAKKAGVISKDIKTSVRISRYSMGQSIIIDVRNFEALYGKRPRSEQPDGTFPFCNEAVVLKANLEAIGGRYNQDTRSDQPDDYYSCNFFLTVSL